MATPGKFVFVTGLSGAGKTTLGELLKKNDNYVHFNVDVWAFGGDPIAESNAVPGPDMLAKRDPVIKAAFDNMVANGYTKLSAGQEVDFAVWEQFYCLLCPAILAARESVGVEKDIVVTFSAYLRCIREYLRQNLGNSLIFIVLNPSIDSVGQRKVAHLKNTAAARGQTLSQFLRSFHPDSDAPDMEESVLVGILAGQARAASIGFEPAGSDEARTLGVEDCSEEEVLNRVREFLLSLN